MPAFRLFVFSIFMFMSLPSLAQRFLSDYDSTLFLKDTMPQVIRRLENLRFSGYMQPQFQVADEEGASSFSGGNFQEYSKSRFMLRRARIKVDYILPSLEQKLPLALFTFQIDATERGVFVRDMFLKLFEPAHNQFSLTTGLFARPFGYEVNLSSAFRETPERGRMSQILMPTERDLGVMVSWHPEYNQPSNKFQLDAGVFNGQGLAATAEFDSYKDVITRATMQRVGLAKNVWLSGGLSFLNGGLRQQTNYSFLTKNLNGTAAFVADSSGRAIGRKAEKRYGGADVQLVFGKAKQETEFRAEYWRGIQPGTASSTANQGALPNTPLYIRHFDGAFFYFLQSLGSGDWELMLKYDWYDPNTRVGGQQIGKPNTGFTAADVRFDTFGAGMTYYFNPQLKILAYYSFVRNERTALPDYSTDRPDNIFTCRMQLRF